MEVFNRLAIGTANWGQSYNGRQIPEEEQKSILDYCQSCEIDMIDWSTYYGTDFNPLGISSYFKKILKYHHLGRFSLSEPFLSEYMPYCLMAHGAEHFHSVRQHGRESPDYVTKYGASIYEPSDLNRLPLHLIDVLQIPYSLFDRRFERYFAGFKAIGIEIHARSIFLRGKILEKAKPHEAIAFCLMNPYVDKVIIGVDSFGQLKDDLRYFHRLNEMQETDENIIDPRKWKDKK